MIGSIQIQLHLISEDYSQGAEDRGVDFAVEPNWIDISLIFWRSPVSSASI